MKNYLFLIALFAFSIGTAQQKDSVPVQNSDVLQTVLKRNVSLEKELLFYRVKEDYYAAALSEQATRFALIISSILAVAALFSYTWYRLERRRVNKLIAELRSEIHDQNNKIIETQEELNLLSASSARFISDQLDKEQQYVTSFSGYLFEATSHLKSTDEESNLYVAPALRRSLNSLRKIKGDISQMRILRDLQEKAYQELKFIEATGNPELDKICAEIRVQMQKMLDV